MVASTIEMQSNQDQRALEEAATFLRAGQCVAFPTETVYGLGADATNSSAVRNIFEAKGRPSDNPLIVHLHDASAVQRWVGEPTDLEKAIMAAFWPGPLTIVFSVQKGVFSDLVTAGLDTVGLRVPAHEVARKLIEITDRPIAAPSANRSGRPSPTTADHVLEDLGEQIAGVVDGGNCSVGVESTVIRCIGEDVIVLRPGGVSIDSLRTIAKNVMLSDELRAHDAPRSPGMKYTHYAPKGETSVFLVSADSKNVVESNDGIVNKKLVTFAEENMIAKDSNARTAVIAFGQTLTQLQRVANEQGWFGQVVLWFDLDSGIQAVDNDDSALRHERAAKSIYRALRLCDELQASSVWVQGCDEVGIGLAYMNRIRKAADGRVFVV